MAKDLTPGGVALTALTTIWPGAHADNNAKGKLIAKCPGPGPAPTEEQVAQLAEAGWLPPDVDDDGRTFEFDLTP